ncbi:MAG: hypothetical protein HQK65_10645 [Desulfamplus sp.]|nr:hypothetical protein [Desulfamplus sp.]
MIIDNIPTHIYISKNKKVALNMNTYRNLHFQANNKAKYGLLTAIKLNGKIQGTLSTPPYEFIYTIYRRDKKRADLMNIGSIVDKFTSDALVNLGYITDDNTDIIKRVTVIDGGIDKNNPRATLEIIEMR